MRPDREHDTTAVRTHTEILPALRTAAGDLRTLADLGYEGESDTFTVAFKKPKAAGSRCFSSSSTRPTTACGPSVSAATAC